MKDKRQQYDKRHDKVILQHDNTRHYVAKIVQETLQVLNWVILSHLPYSPDIAPSDYHLFWSMHSVLKGSASVAAWKSQNGSINGLLPRNQIFFSWNPFVAWKMGKRCNFQWKVFWMKYISFYYLSFYFTFYKRNRRELSCTPSNFNIIKIT